MQIEREISDKVTLKIPVRKCREAPFQVEAPPVELGKGMHLSGQEHQKLVALRERSDRTRCVRLAKLRRRALPSHSSPWDVRPRQSRMAAQPGCTIPLRRQRGQPKHPRRLLWLELWKFQVIPKKLTCRLYDYYGRYECKTTMRRIQTHSSVNCEKLKSALKKHMLYSW